MKTLLLQIENRTTEPLKTFMDSNRRTCDALNIEYVFRDRGPGGVPPYWWKVLVLKELMLERLDVDIFMWLDSDAFLIPPRIRHRRRVDSAGSRHESRPSQDSENPLASLAARFPEADLFIGPDAPMYSMAFNAGAFLVRNSPRGRALMQRWADLFDPRVWIETKPGIFMTPGPWAGSAYEQGAFILNLLEEPGVKRLPYFVFNEVRCDDFHEEAISVHLAGNYKKDEAVLNACLRLVRENRIEDFLGSRVQESTSSESGGILLVVGVVFLGVLLTLIVSLMPKRFLHHRHHVR
jgi:hypothetical protein